jgi:hypothetical protein
MNKCCRIERSRNATRSGSESWARSEEPKPVSSFSGSGMNTTAGVVGKRLIGVSVFNLLHRDPGGYVTLSLHLDVTRTRCGSVGPSSQACASIPKSSQNSRWQSDENCSSCRFANIYRGLASLSHTAGRESGTMRLFGFGVSISG